MSMQYSSGPNPFEVANRFIGNLYSKGTRSRRDQEQHSLTQQTLALHAAQYGATMEQANQQHKLTQRAERGKTKRATSFATTIHGFAQPGAQVSIKHGDISASYTAKNPVTPTVQKLGRVPVKKNRGGKRPQ